MMKLTIKQSAVLIAIGAFTVLVSSCGKKQEQVEQKAPDIATMTVSLGSNEVDNAYPAQIKGKTDIDIRPQVTGFITKVHVDEGQHVSKGQVLFTLDQVQFKAAVDQAAAAVNAAQTAVKTAQLTADTKRQLFEKNIISQYEYQLAQNDLLNAKAALAQANSGLVNAKKNLSYTVVTAPSSGVVGSIPNREGSLASPSSMEPLTTISDNSQVYAYFSLTEKDLLKMTDGGQRSVADAIKAMPEVELRLSDGSMYPFKGKVATVSGVINTSTGAASVRALFDNPSGMLRSGSTGNILLPNVSEEVIVVPQKATFELQDRRFVYVVNDSNKVVSVPVTVGEGNDGKNFVITSGLKPGDRIAIEGVGTVVKDGIVINPVDPAEREKQQAAALAAQAAGK